MPRYPCPKSGKKNIYPSVTEIISDCTNSSGALTQWAANMVVEYLKEFCELDQESQSCIIDLEPLDKARFHFREVSQKALDIGSDVHDMVERYLKSDAPILPKGKTEEADIAFGAFLDWEEENDLKPIKVEKKVYGDRWAGTLDFYGHFNDKLYVIDWKSSKAHYPEMRYQVAAYKEAMQDKLIQKMVGEDTEYFEIEGCGVLRLDKETGLPDFKDHSKSSESDLAIFNSMVELYYLRHPRIAKKFREATK